MRSRLASVVGSIATLLLAMGAARASEIASGSAVSTGRAVAALPPEALADAQRLPLSTTAAQLGVIVVINGTDIHIIRPDGSQSRVVGVSSDAQKAGGRRRSGQRDGAPVIRDGEAWATPREIALLLGSEAGSAANGGAGPKNKGEAEGPSFETFEVKKPTVSSPAPLPTQITRPLSLAQLVVETTRDRTWADISPIAMNLGLSRTSGLSGPASRGIYQESIGPPLYTLESRQRGLDPSSPFSPVLSYFNMDISEAGRRYQLGDVFDPLFGTATGIMFSTALSDSTRAGASVMLPTARPGERAKGQLSLRAETRAGRELTTEAGIAADGSYYTSARWERPRFSLYSSALEGSENRRRALWGQVKATPALAILGRASAVEGWYQDEASALGLRWSLGRAQAAVERARGTSSGEGWLSDAFSISFFRRPVAGIVRYVAMREGTGRSGLEWSLSRAAASGRQMFLSSSAPPTGDGGGGRSYRLGTYSPVSRRVRVQTALAWESSAVHPECRIEWRPARDQVVSVRYGSFDSGLPSSGPEMAFAVQAALAFGGPGRAGAGTAHIGGQVRDDAGRGVPDVAVLLDDGEVAVTRSDGSYQFLAVSEGRHTLRLDPERIPADLEGDLRARTVFATPQERGRADFTVTRLCLISGRVYVETGSGQQAPLAGVAVELNTGARTTSDDQGRYQFSGLRPGRYTVALPDQPRDPLLSPVPPSSWAFRLEPGQRASGADFGFRQQERPVVFGRL